MTNNEHPCFNSPFLKALRQESVDFPPIWLMRQAGRYLPEYREIRAKAGSFLALCKSPELACEVTLQPLTRFRLDAGIIFSDILTIPEAMDLGLNFVEGQGPIIKKPICQAQDIKSINHEKIIPKLKYVFDAISLTRKHMALNIPLIGFSGSPFTLACYMIEGGSSRDFLKLKKILYSGSDLFTALIDKLTHTISDYLLEQISSGVNAIQIFDTWGGILSTPKYKRFSLEPMARIIRSIKKKYPTIPIIIFTKGGGIWLKDQIACTQADAISLDWTIEIGQAFSQINNQVTLQGNLDPHALISEPKFLLAEVKTILDSVKTARKNAYQHNQRFGFVFNLGHGVIPQVPPENVGVLIEYVHSYSFG